MPLVGLFLLNVGFPSPTHEELGWPRSRHDADRDHRRRQDRRDCRTPLGQGRGTRSDSQPATRTSLRTSPKRAARKHQSVLSRNRRSSATWFSSPCLLAHGRYSPVRSGRNSRGGLWQMREHGKTSASSQSPPLRPTEGSRSSGFFDLRRSFSKHLRPDR
jgi:hypothetical protein